MPLLYLLYTFYTASIPLLYLFHASSMYLYTSSIMYLFYRRISSLREDSEWPRDPGWTETAFSEHLSVLLFREIYFLKACLGNEFCPKCSDSISALRTLACKWNFFRNRLFIIVSFLLWQLLRNDSGASWQSWTFNLTNWSNNSTFS